MNRTERPLPARGERIRLPRMNNNPHPIGPGAEGTVTRSSRMQIGVTWDNGWHLDLAPDVDDWEVIG